MASLRLRRLALVAAAVALAGCAAILGIDDGIPRDASTDAVALDVSNGGDGGGPDVVTQTMCDVDAAFGAPKLVTTLDTTVNDAHLRLSQDELAAYFQSNRDGGAGSYDIWTASRAAIDAGWTKVSDVSNVNSTSSEIEPGISGNELSLFLIYASDIYEATRNAPDAAFSVPTAVAALNTTASESGPYPLPNGAMYFTSTRASDAGVFALYRAAPAGTGFATPVAVAGNDLAIGDVRFGAVTPDELVMYIASTRTGNMGGRDIYVTTRASTSDPWGPSRVVSEVSSGSNEYPDWISPDRCRLYFTSNRSDAGDDNMYVAEKPLP